jgi:DNA-binding LacI/PurR family transcriptional regulator
VVGYDNIEESAYFYPSLTTISQDHQLIGETAVQTLIKMIKKAQKNQPAESHAIVFEPTLIVRESSVVSD